MIKDIERKVEPYRISHGSLKAPYQPGRPKHSDSLNEHALFEARRFYQYWQKQKAQPRTETTRDKFRRLAAQWKEEAAFLPNARKMATLDSYQQIIGMGEAALPYILNDLRKEPNYWFWALRAISGANPVPPLMRGDMEAMSLAWVQWGIENRFIR